jgi:mRNA-degrading endonuclease RelE of RelBE toxin-antitoxin system
VDTLWTVELRRSADAELDALPRNLLEAALEMIASFQDDPFPPDHVKLERCNDLYRVRLDGWRIVYRVNPRRRIVHIERIRARGEAYKGL